MYDNLIGFLAEPAQISLLAYQTEQSDALFNYNRGRITLEASFVPHCTEVHFALTARATEPAKVPSFVRQLRQ